MFFDLRLARFFGFDDSADSSVIRISERHSQNVEKLLSFAIDVMLAAELFSFSQ